MPYHLNRKDKKSYYALSYIYKAERSIWCVSTQKMDPQKNDIKSP